MRCDSRGRRGRRESPGAILPGKRRLGRAFRSCRPPSTCGTPQGSWSGDLCDGVGSEVAEGKPASGAETGNLGADPDLLGLRRGGSASWEKSDGRIKPPRLGVCSSKAAPPASNPALAAPIRRSAQPPSLTQIPERRQLALKESAADGRHPPKAGDNGHLSKHQRPASQ